MAGRNHIARGDPAHNLLNQSGRQLIALDGAGAVRYGSQCALSKGIQSYSNLPIVTTHKLLNHNGKLCLINLELTFVTPTCEYSDSRVFSPT